MPSAYLLNIVNTRKLDSGGIYTKHVVWHDVLETSMIVYNQSMQLICYLALLFFLTKKLVYDG